MEINFNDLQTKLNNLIIKKQPKTFLKILDKEYNEVLVSKYLAYFLDEMNTNRDILKQILTYTSSRNGTDNFVELLNDVEFEDIQTEEQISEHSRVDIIIKYSSFWIVVENKINAFESKVNQTVDYERQLKEINKDHIPVKYIYLKPNFNKSKASNKNFSELLYSDLINIFKKVKKESLNDIENYLYFMDFIKHMEEYFMKSNQRIDDPALQVYFENKNKIDHIINIYNQESQKVRLQIVDSLKNAFPNYRVHDTSTYIQIFKDTWENRGSTGIHFEIVASNTKFDTLLGKETVRLRFCIHNEKNTREKYSDIAQETINIKKYMFNNDENITKSINDIIQEVQSLINKYEKLIDTTIASKK